MRIMVKTSIILYHQAENICLQAGTDSTIEADVMRIIIVMIFFAIFGGIASSGSINDKDLLYMLQHSPTTADFPHEDAIWLLRDMQISIDSTGSFTVHEHNLAKILTARGASLAQWEIPYDKASETLDIITARTWLNGQAFSVDPAQVADNSVYSGLAWYDSMTVRRFPLPSAVPGAVLEVELDHSRTVPRVPSAFATRLYLRQKFPVLEARYTIRTPIDMRLDIRFTNGETSKVEEQLENGFRVYRWSMKNLPPLTLNEPQLPPVDDIVPSVHITSLASWEPVVKWYQQITDGKDKVTEDLRRVALERTAGCKTEEEKIAALHKAVREIPYVALEMGNLSDVPHDADSVARQNYGDCKDKATLLRALLKAVDIPADYVLVRTTNRGALDKQQYGVEEFNHVILVAHTDSGDRFLDATIADAPANVLPLGVNGAEGLIIRGKGHLATLPRTSAGDGLANNGTTIVVQVWVADDGSAKGKTLLNFRGLNAVIQRGTLANVATDRYKEVLEGYLAERLGQEISIDTVEVSWVKEPERSLDICATFTSPTYIQKAGNQWSGYLPGFAYQPNIYRTTKERHYPFYMNMESRMDLEIWIVLPKSFKVSSLPSPIRYSSPIGRYWDSFSTKGQKIHYQCNLLINQGTISAEKLDEMRKWYSTLALEGRNKLQFFLHR